MYKLAALYIYKKSLFCAHLFFNILTVNIQVMQNEVFL